MLSYTPQTHVQYRLAEKDELSADCTVDMRTRPGNRVVVLFSPYEISTQLPHDLTRISSHQVAHGSWRQPGQDTPQGHWLSVTRWERVSDVMLPTHHMAVAVEETGSCIWLVDEDECTHRLQNDMNDLLHKLACRGVYLQCWFPSLPQPPGGLAVPALRPSEPLPVQ